MRKTTAEKAKRAYQMRKRTGCTWSVIAKSMGYSRVGAWQTCRRWARQNRKPWPPAPLLTVGKICYDMASKDQMSWKEIAEELGKTATQAQKAARSHCLTHSIEWPQLGRFNQNGQSINQ